MSRLPTPGGDNGTWGAILNDFLSTSHAADGALLANTISAAQLRPNAVTTSAILDGSVTPAKIQNAGQSNGVATLNGSGVVPDTQLPSRLSQSELNATLATARLANVATKTGTSATFTSNESSGFVRCTAPTLVTVSLPTDASATLPIGFWAALIAEGAEGVTVNTSSVTVIGESPFLTVGQNGVLTILKVGANTWSVLGGVAP